MGSRPRLYEGRLCGGMTEGDGSPHPRGQREGEQEWGMDSRPRLHEGRLFAGKTEGAGG